MFSVIIATHNRPVDLAHAVESVLKQTMLPEELIIVDDGSEIAVDESLFLGFPSTVRCILIRNDAPLGAAAARNKGIVQASQDFICFLDDDDLFVPEKLRSIYNEIENERFDLYFHSYVANFVNEKISYKTSPYHGNKLTSVKDIFSGNFIGGTPLVVVCREKLISVGMFDCLIPAMEDYELWVKLIISGVKIKYINKPLSICNFFSSRDSLSMSDYKDKLAVIYFKNKYSQIIESFPNHVMEGFDTHNAERNIYQAQMKNKILRAFYLQMKLGLRSRSAKRVCKSFMYLAGLRCYLIIARVLSRKNDL